MGDESVFIEKTFRDCAAGSQVDCDAFFGLVRPLFARIAARIARQYSAEADVEDIVQEVSMHVAANPADFAAKLPKDKALPYFAVVAANLARDWFRAKGAKKRGRDRTTQLNEDTFCPNGERLSPQERSLLLHQIVRSLPEPSRERAVFQLYFQQGYSAREIAAIPALTLTTKGVESLILRLTRQLREKLTPDEGFGFGKASSR
jgi:RNA polymerase sigma-70 factor (ECF subfamily)